MSKRLSRSIIDHAVEEALFKIGKAEEIGAKNCPVKCPIHGVSRAIIRTELQKHYFYEVKLPPGSEYLVVVNI